RYCSAILANVSPSWQTCATPTGAPALSTISAPCGKRLLIQATRRARSSSGGPGGGAGSGAAAGDGALGGGGAPPDSVGRGTTEVGDGCAAEHPIDSTKHQEPKRAHVDRQAALIRTYKQKYQSPMLGNIPAQIRAPRQTSWSASRPRWTPRLSSTTK